MGKIPFNLDSYEGADVPCSEVARFVVLYGKASTRKHKIWEGDGILICYDDFCVLKSDDEKDVICRSSALKRLEDMEDGRIVNVGSWSVQIQERESVKKEGTSQTKPDTVIVKKEEPRKFANPIAILTPVENRKRPAGFSSPVVKNQTIIPAVQKYVSPIGLPAKRGYVNPMLGMDGDVQEKVAAFVLNDREVIENRAVPICVDPRFVRYLREHQKEGIKFIFEKLKTETGGAILADDMGLGKSIQTMASTWALMKGAKNNQNLASKCLIVVPSSLVNNWKAEFNKWWRNMLFPAVVLQKASDIDSYLSTQKSLPYLIISYDMALRYVEKLKNIRFDMIVCDEGHKLKNRDSKLRKALASLEIPRRLILTGTPMQNDYEEFYSLLDFIRPGQFGTAPKFLKLCSEEPAKLNEMIDECMLRRTSEVNNSHLPKKHEYIMFCAASEIQQKVHESICDMMTGDALSLIFLARQLVNHPKLMYDNLMEKHQNGNQRNSSLLLAFPDRYLPKGGVKESGKLRTLLDMMKCFRLLNECAVIVSNYIDTLDMIEQLCSYLEFKVYRLDGQTNVADRQKLVKQFNDIHDSQNVFLLSTKAGGVGLNLIGASRLVLFDSDWNPANDQQAMARIWRDGQVRPCHIYRLVTTGTIEEKMLQRQIKKTGLGCVIDAIEVGDTVSTFSDEELYDIFTFTPNTESNTHDLCECKCDGSGMLENELVDSDDEDDMEEMDDEALEDQSPDSNEVVDDSFEEVVLNTEVVHEKDEKEEKETGRATLAELSRWRHFSPRHPETWKHFLVNAGLSSVDANVDLTFAFYLTSQF